MEQSIEKETKLESSANTRNSISRFFSDLLHSKTGLAGFIIICLLVLIGCFGFLVTPFNPLQAQLNQKLLPPLAQGHLFGTDELGRDVLSRIIVGARVSLTIGVVTVVLAGAVGTIIGILAGFFRGWIDVVLMRIVDVQLSFPFILLVLVVNAVLGGGLRNIIVSLVIAGWVIFARVVRSEVLALREKEFIVASVATGVGKLGIMIKHILPNLFTPIIILASLEVADFIIAEASVSFLGFGVQPPQPAWGNMLNEGKDYIFNAWWLITFPGLAIVMTALGINLFGDWLRDELNNE
ncbi:MAG: ABC transporter permease [Sporolactobacillus sp.]|jgi:peptide/nickel transport system permease protein|nr:ABC transporter permease [Sporolactobacillus sp.]